MPEHYPLPAAKFVPALTGIRALAAMQLTDTAGDMQIRNASLGGIFNMGGTAVANYVSILERIK